MLEIAFFFEEDYMFKDYDKYLKTSLKVYLFVLVIVFIMKLVGLDYFGLDVNNPTMIKISEFCIKFKIDYIYSYINCFITVYIMASLSIKEDSKNLKKFILFTMPLTIAVKYLVGNNNNFIYVILQMVYLYIMLMIYKRKIVFKYFKRYIITNVLFLILQIISTIFRNQNFNYSEYNFIVAFLLNFDYLIMTILIHKLYFLKGGNLCYQVEEAGFCSLKKINLKTLLKRLQANLHNFKKQTKENKIAIIIYLGLSLIWNIFTIFVVLLIATLNHTFIECIFILTSFWLSKKVFGKAFHLSSMVQCFIVSNLTYYALNRITTPLGISIFIPIALGVGLSYVTSKFVKKTYKPLYKGMPEELFEETILKVVDKDSKKYQICYDFYILNQSDLSLSFKYNYSVAGIRKIKDRINAKIKELMKVLFLYRFVSLIYFKI